MQNIKKRFQSQKVQHQIQELIQNLLYVDDRDFIAHLDEDLQHIMGHFSATCDVFGVKTKLMFNYSPDVPYKEPKIQAGG